MFRTTIGPMKANPSPPSTSDPSESPYIPIDQTIREIRLLEIQPGAFDDDLVLNMRVKRLERKRPKYEALSYVWGKEPCSRPALLNGKPVTVGRNLDCALRHLRTLAEDQLESSLLWVDALCINQDDVAERNHQVQLMSKIYSTATDVVIWLGPERPHDEFILDRIRRRCIPEDFEEMLKVLKVLKRLCRRPWFGRLWIAQELALSSDPRLLLGRSGLLWRDLFDYVGRIYEIASSVCRGKSDCLPYLPCFYFDQAARRVIQLGSIKHNNRAAFAVQLQETAGLLASDPRDKVFGLLSICSFSSRQREIVANYSRTVQEIYAEATFTMLLERDCPYVNFHLQPLLARGATRAVAENKTSNLPSWTLDLSLGTEVASARTTLRMRRAGFMIPMHTNYVSLLQRLSWLPVPVKVSSDLTRLSTVGKFLGTIVETTGNMFDTRGVESYIQLPSSALYDIYNTMIKPRHISARIFLQTLTIDNDDVIDNPALFEELLSNRIPDDDSRVMFGGHYQPMLAKFHAHNDMVLFVTAERQVGMAYHPDFGDGIRPGDIVVGLLGINYPFILRAVPGDSGRGQLYNMINVAHVANHKWGHEFVERAPPKAKWRDFRKFGLNEYTLV